jgi:hypothetical protein
VYSRLSPSRSRERKREVFKSEGRAWFWYFEGIDRDTTRSPSFPYNGPSIKQYHHPSFTINIVIVTNFCDRDPDLPQLESGGAGTAATLDAALRTRYSGCGSVMIGEK